MKKLIFMLLCFWMLIALTVPVYGTETSSPDAPCSHNWTTVSETQVTCIDAGEKKSVCSLCAEEKTETFPAAGHQMNTPIPVDDSSHRQSCTVCGVSETASHNWGEGTVVTQATCTAEGYKTYTCTCGKTKTETVPKLEHDFNDWIKTAGNHERTCKNCTNKESGKHSVKEEILKEATCLEAGSKKKYCTVCGINEVIVIPKLTEHAYDNACDPDCNACGEKRDTKHSYASSWSRDHSGHWHECTKCGQKVDFRAHYPGPAATEEAPQLCVTCDYVIAAQKEHVHNYAKKWTQDDSGHWYTCASCSVKKDFAAHVYDGACDEYCNVCDYKNPSAHDFGNSWESDERKHWAVCRICNQKSEAEQHIPGPEATENQAQLCTVCGYEIAAAQEHVHSFGPVWMYDGKSHWQACICGEQTVPAPHNWDSGTKNKDKTVTYQCELCHAEYSEKASGFPWWVLVIFLLLAAGGGAAAYVYYILPQKQGGKFSAN